MTFPLEQRVLQALIECEHSLSTPLLVGVSGGADSVALFRAVCQLVDSPQQLCAVTHVNHLLRGDASYEDERFVQALADGLGCRCFSTQINIREIAENSNRGIEETARSERYSYFKRIAAQHQLSTLLLAHTADDQAETVLHHCIRGTGLQGLMGIPMTRPLNEGFRLIRPLLRVTRSEIEQWLESIDQDYCIDSSNTQTSYTRNRIRLDLIPILEGEYNPQVKSALVNLSYQASELQSMMRSLSLLALEQATLTQELDDCVLSCEELSTHPRPLIRECFVQLWRKQNWPRQKMTFEHWERLADLVIEGTAIMFPGTIRAERKGVLLHLTRE